MKTRSLMIVALMAIAAVDCTTRVAAAASNIDLPALRSYVEVPSLALSPGGTRVAVVVERQNFKTNRYDRHIEVIDCVTRATTAVTPNLSGLSDPAWSPDGLSVAYIADAPDGTSQVFAALARGGPARRLTHAPRGVETFAWRPDGSAIAYVTPDAAANEKAIAAGLDAFEVGNQDYLSVAKPTPSHLWLQSAAGGAPRRLTSGPRSLPRGELIFPLPEVAPMPFFAWAPDGKSIVFARMDNAYNSDAVGTVTHVLDVATGALHKLTSHRRLEAGGRYSPDGTRIAYAYARDDNPLAQAVMMIAPSGGGDGVAATQALDIDALGAHWLTGHKTGWPSLVF